MGKGRYQRPFAANWEKKYGIPIILVGKNKQALLVPIRMKEKCSCGRYIDSHQEFQKHWLLFHSAIPEAWRKRLRAQ